ncbi:Myrcene synthase, chloroplastic [Quillaja saponaria]|uniref:Myrcene synthase, chloroplastic n=1 Tax=Quillaja saponaria TaxID=32244 RepID=A0AAD7L2N0_QUISA|nr:Myrcene synthase, chloroplastic [Quillaja saponaria]
MDKLPESMKMLFLAIHNNVNEVAFEILRDQGFNVIPCLKKYWAEYCEGYLVEARWLHNGYKPSLQEYLDNACNSIGVRLVMVHAYFAIANPTKKEALDCLEECCPNIFQWTAMMVRLADDLGTFSRDVEMGDSNNSIQHYMDEMDASEEEAREYIKCLIDETWKKINRDKIASSPFPLTLSEMCVNFSRMVLRMYQHGDGYTSQAQDIKDIMSSIIFDPIPL